MKKSIKKLVALMFLSIALFLNSAKIWSQEVEVQGQLKVSQMDVNENGEDLVIRNADGILGTRSVALLPPPPPPIDTTRNLASDYELAEHLCNCPNLPPFLIQKLLESGYTEGDLIAAGVNASDVIDAQRFGYIIDHRNNQTYKTVKIGNQVWMAENLNIGTMINSTTGGTNSDGEQTENSIIEKYCYDNNASNCDTYGGLYQWDEMMQGSTTAGTQGICPTGWHLPTDDEWKTLEMELGMSQSEADGSGNRGTNEGSKMAGNAALWTDGALENDSEFGTRGFTALPAGYRDIDGSFLNQSYYTELWSSSESGSTAWTRYLTYDNTDVSRYYYDKANGFSVRCLRD